MNEKSLPLAIGLNFLLPGLGYAYMGKWIVAIFAFLIVAGMYLTAGLLLLIPTWIAMNVIMAIDMIILSNKNKKKVAEATTIKCPSCAETIKREAKVCRFCGRDVVPPNALPHLEPTPPAQGLAASPRPAEAKPTEGTTVDKAVPPPIVIGSLPVLPPMVRTSLSATIPAGTSAAVPSIATNSVGGTVEDSVPDLSTIDRATFEREFRSLADMNKKGSLSDAEFAEQRARLIQQAKQPESTNVAMKASRQRSVADVPIDAAAEESKRAAAATATPAIPATQPEAQKPSVVLGWLFVVVPFFVILAALVYFMPQFEKSQGQERAVAVESKRQTELAKEASAQTDAKLSPTSLPALPTGVQPLTVVGFESTTFYRDHQPGSKDSWKLRTGGMNFSYSWADPENVGQSFRVDLNSSALDIQKVSISWFGESVGSPATLTQRREEFLRGLVKATFPELSPDTVVAYARNEQTRQYSGGGDTMPLGSVGSGAASAGLAGPDLIVGIYRSTALPVLPPSLAVVAVAPELVGTMSSITRSQRGEAPISSQTHSDLSPPNNTSPLKWSERAATQGDREASERAQRLRNKLDRENSINLRVPKQSAALSESALMNANDGVDSNTWRTSASPVGVAGLPSQTISVSHFRTVLEAVESGGLEHVKKMVDDGADVNIRINGAMPLIRAAAMGRIELVEFLLSKGADFDRVDGKGHSAMYYAKMQQNAPMVEALTRAGARNPFATTASDKQ